VTNPNEVLFNISVLRKDSKSPVNLKEENFEIREGKEIKKITSFINDGPASIVFVVDTTGSMQSVRPGAISYAVGRFIRDSNPLNEYATVAFGNTVETLQTFTLDYDLVKSSFARVHETPRASKSSPVLDAVNVGISLFGEAKNKKKILVLLTDLMDAGSKTKFSQIKELVRRSNVIIYSIVPYLSESSVSTQAFYYGLDMARITGGNTLPYQDTESLDSAMSVVVLSIEQLYLIGIEPSAKKDEWHEIDVKVVNTDKEFNKRVVVLSRAGYYFKPK